MGIVFAFLAVFVILSIVIKVLAQKLSQDSEPLIGLNNNFAKDSALIRDLNHTKALQNAQTELARAHSKYQDYLKNKNNNNVNNNDKKIGADMVKKSIALNQYRKNDENPYKNQEVIKINKDFTSRDNFQIPPKPQAQKPAVPVKAKNNFTSPYIKRTTNKVEYTEKKEQKPTNMRFLESVTKIYEQSGRNDLARELRSSMLKIK